MISGVGVTSTTGVIPGVCVGGNHSTVGEAVAVITWLAVGRGAGVVKRQTRSQRDYEEDKPDFFHKYQRWITCERSGPTEMIFTGIFRSSSIRET